MSQLKKCPNCSGMVEIQARVCRHCQTNFSGRSRVGGWVAIAVVGLVAWLVYTSDEPVERATTETVEAPEPLSSEVRQQCANLIKQAIDGNVISKRPKPSRIEVADGVWAGLEADAKRNMMATVACDAFGKKPEDLNYSQYIVVYGFTSGKRLAMLTSDGVSFE